MTAGKPTTFTNILNLLVAQLSSVTGIRSEYIFPTLSEDWFEPGGLSDKYIMLSNFAGNEFESITTGAGVDGKWWNATCDVSLVVRLDTDTPGKDINRLADATNGLLATWRLALKAVDQWFPDDGAGAGWLLQPARSMGFITKPRNFRNSGGWAMLKTRIHIPFVQDLT